MLLFATVGCSNLLAPKDQVLAGPNLLGICIKLLLELTISVSRELLFRDVAR
jgi:hypothetical protein